MDFVTRLFVVVTMAAAVAAVAWVWRRHAHREFAGVVSPQVPAQLTDGAERTWVLFTTPYCANCGPAEERLRQVDPSARVVRVDATVEPELAEAFSVRRAPTAVLAGGDGTVQARLVGADAVARWSPS